MSDYSIYPKAIDGFAQIPLAVDRQSPVNAEGVNRLRSGIINIENTLGVAPHISGRFGDFDNVGDRISNLEGEHTDLADIVADLVDPTLDMVYHFGQSILMDNGPIDLTGNDYFAFNDEFGVPIGSIDAGSSLRVLSSGTDLVLNAGGESNDVILRPGTLGLDEDFGVSVPGTIRVESSEAFTLGGPNPLRGYMAFGGGLLDSRAVIVDDTGEENFVLAVGLGAMADPTVAPYGLELTVLGHSAPNTPGKGISLLASPGTGLEPGGPVSIRSGEGFDGMTSSQGSFVTLEGGSKDFGGRVFFESGGIGASSAGSFAHLSGATSTEGGGAFVSAGSRNFDHGASLSLAGGGAPKGGEASLVGGSATPGSGSPAGAVHVQGGDSDANLGGDLFLIAGSGVSGGMSHIHSGNATSGSGGDMMISAGDSDSGDVGETGGSANLIGGNSNAGPGGSVNIDSGDSNGGVTGATRVATRGGPSTAGTGELIIQTGHSGIGDTGAVVVESGGTSNDASGNAGNSGDLSLRSGGTTQGNSGDIQLSTGGTQGGDAGNIDILTGSVNAPGGAGGSISLRTGQVSNGSSGVIIVESGPSSAAPSGPLNFRSGPTNAGPSGIVALESGPTTGGGDSGMAYVASGMTDHSANSGEAHLASGLCLNGGDSGHVMVKTGDSQSNSGRSGSLIVSSGGADNVTGHIIVKTGDSSSAESGNITLNTGMSPNVGGTIYLTAGDGGAAGGDVTIAPGNSLASGSAGSVNIDGKVNISSALSLPITTWTSTPAPGGNIFDVDDQHFTILVDSQVANTTVHLPDAVDNPGRVYNIKRIDNTAFTPQVVNPSGNSIDGMAAKVLSSQWDCYTFQSDGTDWYII